MTTPTGIERGQVWRHRRSGQNTTVLSVPLDDEHHGKVIHRGSRRVKWTSVAQFRATYKDSGAVDVSVQR